MVTILIPEQSYRDQVPSATEWVNRFSKARQEAEAALALDSNYHKILPGTTNMMSSTKNYSNHSLNPLSTYNQTIHQHHLIWLKKKRNTKLKPSLTVTKRDNILSIWSNGKANLMWKTHGNHGETYDMLKKKWKTSTKNIQTNRNPLLLIEESSSLQIAQSSTPLNQCSN